MRHRGSAAKLGTSPAQFLEEHTDIFLMCMETETPFFAHLDGPNVDEKERNGPPSSVADTQITGDTTQAVAIVAVSTGGVQNDKEKQKNKEDHEKDEQQKKNGKEKEKQDETKQKNQGKKKYVPDRDIFDSIFGRNSETWTRFWKCCLDEDLGVIDFRTKTKKEIGPNFTFYKQGACTYIVDVKTKENSEKFEKLERIGTAYNHKMRDIKKNSSQVTVLLTRNLKEEIEEMEQEQIDVNEKLKEALIEEGVPVETIVHYTRKSRRGHRSTSLMFLRITVNSRTPPEEIILGSELLLCKQVKEKPTQCHTCWKFGHPKKYCKGENMCVLCTKTDHNIDYCPLKTKAITNAICINCGENGHAAMSKICLHYQKEAEIISIKEKSGVTRRGALQLLKKFGQFQSTTYAKRASFGLRQPFNLRETLPRPKHQLNGSKSPSPPARTPSPRRTPPQQKQSPGNSPPARTSSPMKKASHDTEVNISTYNPFEILNVNIDEVDVTIEESIPSIQEISKNRIPSPKTKNIPASSRSDPLGAIDKAKPKRPERKRKNPPTNVELDRSIRQKKEEQHQESREKQEPNMARESQSIDNDERERPEESKEEIVRSREIEVDEVEENLLKMGLSPLNISKKIDAHGSDFLSMESMEEVPSGETNFPPLGKVPHVEADLPIPIDSAWSTPPDLKEKPDNKPPSPKKAKLPPKKFIITRGTDGQHGGLPNCGCHDCILQVLIIKGEPKGKDKTISKSLIDQIKKEFKVGHGTSKQKHSQNCLRVYDLEDW